MQAQVREGRALPLAEKTAAYQLAYSRQVDRQPGSGPGNGRDVRSLSRLGFAAEDRVRPVESERPAPALPRSDEQAMQTALESNKELRRIESQIASKQLEVRGQKAARWPRIDLVAQYGMLARFNNYEQFFQNFQRHNGEIGASFQLPVLAGSGVGAQAAQAQTDVSHLKVELSNARNRIASDLQQSLREVRRAAGAADLARLDLEVAREQLSVNLAQVQEGRLSMREVEQARVVENQKWIAFYDAQYAAEKAQWNVLRLTGGLVSSIEALP